MRSTQVQKIVRCGKWSSAAALAVMVSVPVVMRAAHQPGAAEWSKADRDDEPEGSPIRHVVVIFQENVSFDHYFATYPTAANTDGSHFVGKPGTPVVNGIFPGGLLDHNPNSTQPFRLSPSQAATSDQGHGYKQEQQSYNAGGMNRFPETVGVGGPPCLDYGKGKGLVMATTTATLSLRRGTTRSTSR